MPGSGREGLLLAQRTSVDVGGASGISLFAGVDYGRVSGPNAAYLAGTQLAGAVIGVRGNAKLPFGFVAGEVFAGTPVYKPTSFQTARTTVGFSLTAQF